MKNYFLPFATLVILISGTLNSCKPDIDNSFICCDAENMDNNRFISNNPAEGRLQNITFDNIETRTDRYSRSGIHSVGLTKERPYSMTCVIKNVQPGEHFNVSVYRHKSNPLGCLVVSAENIEKFYLVQHKSSRLEGDWEFMDADFVIPALAKGQNFKIYTWNNSSDTTVYFDDLKIRYISSTPPFSK